MKAFSRYLLLSLFAFALSSCSNPTSYTNQQSNENPELYSAAGRENEVTFDAVTRIEATSVESVLAWTQSQKDSFVRYNIPNQLQFLFGPLTHRSLGGPQRGQQVVVDWSSATLVNGKVQIPFTYKGLWILDKDVAAKASFELPFPYNVNDLLTTKWKRCTDSDPEHQTESFYWYFWDPTRSGCDHILGTHYQVITVKVGAQTVNTQNTYPQYEDLLKSNGLENNLQMTFAFGYVTTPSKPNPETDSDSGMYEYRDFVNSVRMQLGSGFTETAVLQKEYLTAVRPEAPVGKRFVGKLNGVNVTVNIVTAGDIDQMDLFAKSFAHDHDGFFGWMGHSRVGSGFDADRFKQIVKYNPEYFSILPLYQFVYWGGCNSYSYYTLPFFDMKAQASLGTDITGTKGLDILANGLPSLFSFNSDNAFIIFKALMSWQNKTSYQTLVSQIEARAEGWGQLVLVVVLGDEDNKQ